MTVRNQQTRSILQSLAMTIACLLLTQAAAHATLVEFNFTASGTAGAGTGSTTAWGNTRTYSQFEATLGLTMKVSAWATTGSSGVFETAHLLQWSTYGFGVCNREETSSAGDCTIPIHQIDNVDNVTSDSTVGYDFVLFQFDREVELSTLDINPYNPTAGYDRDLTYFYGTTVYNNTSFISGRSISYLTTTAGLTRVDDDSTVSDDVRTIALSPVRVNTLLIAARLSGNGADGTTDRWKPEALAVNVVPEPATFAMVGLALIGLGVIGRKRTAR